MGKAINRESPLCEVIVEGTKIQSPKDHYGTRVNITKSRVRLYNIEAEEDRTRTEIKGVQLEESVCKKSVENLLERMNTTEPTFNAWCPGVMEEVSGCKKSLDNLLERININESNFYELCKEKRILKNETDNLKKENDERVKLIERLRSEN